LAVALDASLQARELVKGLLAFAGRHGTANTGRCDPKDVVTRIEAMCRQTFPREIELLSRVEDDAGHVAMPASNLEQVLLNLLLNARDAVLDTVDRTRRIEIVLDRVRAAADGVGTKLRLRVIDNGAGMSEAVRRKIFEPFFSTKPPHRGSGLGLANALVRVREAHGTLECTSEAGVGTTFTLLLDELNDGASSAASRAPSPVPPGHGGETLLIVDDEPLVRRVIADVLALEGYVVLQAGSAAEARELLERHAASVRLILLDWSMPLESGVEALASLKRLSAAPIVMFTGVAADLPPGATAVLAKPARTEELCRVIREVIRGAAVR
jgi:CheY-like chemotaxis protein